MTIAQAAVVTLCGEHKRIIKAMATIQAAQKRERDQLNRCAGIGKNEALKVLNDAISWRRCLLMQIHFRAEYMPIDHGCPACSLSNSYKSVIGYRNGKDVFLECLPSSTVERLICNEKVLSSNLGVGSNSL